MTNVLKKYEDAQVKKLAKGKDINAFAPGDTVRVNVRIVEGTNERIQAFEGVCIAKKNGGLNSSFTVRKISHGEGVERVFPIYSPLVESVTLVRRGSVSRAKLYYMRNLEGKSARIQEKRELLGLVDDGEIAVASDADSLEVVAPDAQDETAAEAKPAETKKEAAAKKAEKKAEKAAKKEAKKSDKKADKKKDK